MPDARILIAALGVTSAALAATPTMTLGPFRTGMTFAELRAAAPELKWEEGTKLESSYRKTLKAPGAIAKRALPRIPGTARLPTTSRVR